MMDEPDIIERAIEAARRESGLTLTRNAGKAFARVMLEDIARDQNPRMIAIYARSIGIDLTAAQPGDKGA